MKTKLTPWSKAGEVPQHVGEYNASSLGIAGVLRWWNGKAWSISYTLGDPYGEVIKARKTKANLETQHCVQFRGLAEKPEGFEP